MLVKEISNDEASILRLAESPIPINLGAQAPSAIVNGLRSRAVQSAARVVLIEWAGSKIPRGAEIDGVAIAWTQNGIVIGANQKQLGTYERLAEFAGKNRNEHRMLVYLAS